MPSSRVSDENYWSQLNKIGTAKTIRTTTTLTTTTTTKKLNIYTDKGVPTSPKWPPKAHPQNQNSIHIKLTFIDQNYNNNINNNNIITIKEPQQAGAELCQAQGKLKLVWLWLTLGFANFAHGFYFSALLLFLWKFWFGLVGLVW